MDIIELFRSQTNNYDFEIIISDKLHHTAEKKNHYSNFVSLHIFHNIFEGLTSHIYRNSYKNEEITHIYTSGLTYCLIQMWS